MANLDYGIAPDGYRLPDATRVGHVKLQVADLARSIGYYQRVLGLRVLERGDAFARLGSRDETPLIELREKPGVRPVSRRGLLGLYHFAILLPDRPSLARFVKHLADIGEYAGMSDHLVSEAVYLTDPDGLGIEVYADRPRASWKAEARQLQMRTDPLNIPDLLASSGGEAWTEMPAGTTMGHVHLFVGDLERAEAFYHRGLGMDKIVWNYPGALFLSAGGYHHHLGTNTWAAGAPSASDDDARLLEWNLRLPAPADAEAAARSIEKAGYGVRQRGSDWVTTDPWGTNLVLAAR